MTTAFPKATRICARRRTPCRATQRLHSSNVAAYCRESYALQSTNTVTPPHIDPTIHVHKQLDNRFTLRQQQFCAYTHIPTHLHSTNKQPILRHRSKPHSDREPPAVLGLSRKRAPRCSTAWSKTPTTSLLLRCFVVSPPPPPRPARPPASASATRLWLRFRCMNISRHLVPGIFARASGSSGIKRAVRGRAGTAASRSTSSSLMLPSR